MTPLVLTGLDGSNPLAFLAALGVLLAVDDASPPDAKPTLAWALRGTWQPTLNSVHADVDALAVALDADRLIARDDPALRFTYVDGGKVVADVKPSPTELHTTLTTWARAATPIDRRTTDWFTGFISEGATDNNGRGKPSALHFTAGQQKFLKAARDLAEGATLDWIREALVGPWSYRSELPVMGWDNTETRDYALRASNPATDKKLGNPGADWLALRGLACLPTAAIRQRQVTTGVEGGWKDGTFAWPLWTADVPAPVVRSLLTMADLRKAAPGHRTRRGIGVVFETQILRSEQGGYGSVTPARAL
jgi:hypothetical protein